MLLKNKIQPKNRNFRNSEEIIELEPTEIIEEISESQSLEENISEEQTIEEFSFKKSKK